MKDVIANAVAFVQKSVESMTGVQVSPKAAIALSVAALMLVGSLISAL